MGGNISEFGGPESMPLLWVGSGRGIGGNFSDKERLLEGDKSGPKSKFCYLTILPIICPTQKKNNNNCLILNNEKMLLEKTT